MLCCLAAWGDSMNLNDVIDKLTPYQALAVVRRLALRGGEIREAVLAEAMTVLDEVDVDEIADAVFDALGLLAVEECWDRSGSSRDGYTSPDEAAAEMIDEELEPYLDQAERYHQLGMFEQERAQCQGVILGLYRYERLSKSEFRGWCEDIPGDCALSLVFAWRERNQDAAASGEMRAFIRQHCPQWDKWLAGEHR